MPPWWDESGWKCDRICATIGFGERPATTRPMKTWVKQFAIVLAAWTAIAVTDGLASYLFRLSIGEAPVFWSVFRRPLTEQWIWAALTPIVFVLTTRFPLARPRLMRSIAVHGTAFLLLSVAHCWVADAIGSPLAYRPVGYQGGLLTLRFLEEIYSDIWMYWPLVCIRALIDSHAKARQRETRAVRLEALLATSRLALLRAQIQPHFLFNTLHSITTLVRTDPVGAEDLIADLAEILRASFAESSSQETTLRRELELVDCYLRIQQRRFSDRLLLVYRIAPEALDAALPPLVLQSLVENAVIHGISPSNRPGTISISARRDADRLLLEVSDDGAGLAESFRPGIGISNARMRMQRLYGNDHSLLMTGAPGCGAAVSISIPFRVAVANSPVGGESDEDPNVRRGRRAACAA
jgi:two-component system LytT family sensor kinase